MSAEKFEPHNFDIFLRAIYPQRAAFAMKVDRMAASLALIKALGGGWDTSKLPFRGSHR